MSWLIFIDIAALVYKYYTPVEYFARVNAHTTAIRLSNVPSFGLEFTRRALVTHLG